MRPHGLQHTRLPCPTTNSGSLLTSIESVTPSNHLILCHPVLLPPSIFPSIRVFSIESALRIRWPKYWSLSFSISPSSEYSELISFRMDWFDLLAVQCTLKSLLQHHSSKASDLWCSAFFMVQLSHPYTTTGNTTALTRRAFAGKGWRAQGYSSVCLQGVSSRGCPCSCSGPRWTPAPDLRELRPMFSFCGTGSSEPHRPRLSGLPVPGGSPASTSPCNPLSVPCTSSRC